MTTPERIIAAPLVAAGLVVLALCAVIVTAHIASELRERHTAHRAAQPDPHAPITLAADELHAVHVAIAFAVALGRLHDDTYVIEARACPEHGRDLVVVPADLAGFDSLADLPKEWVS